MTREQIHELHRRISAVRDQERRSAHGLARLLQRLDACSGYRELGYTSMAEYAAVEQDMTARRTRELLRIGRALPDLPTLDQVFGQGKLPLDPVPRDGCFKRADPAANTGPAEPPERRFHLGGVDTGRTVTPSSGRTRTYSDPFSE